MISEPILLTDLVRYLPPWRGVQATAPDGRFLDLPPASKAPGAEIRIYLERGKPVIGMFRPPAANLPAAVERIASQPIGVLANVQRIDITLHLATPAPDLVFLVGGAPVELPDQGLESRRGRALAELLAGHPGTRVRLVGEASEIWLTRGEIDAAPQDFTLKRTHQGVHVFRRWKSEAVVEELRGLLQLVVE